jgi:predicted nucleotidyltransferase
MLELAAVDLDDLCQALEDHSYETSWWLDPRTGEIRYHNPDVADDGHDDLEAAGLVFIDPVESRDAYEDIAAFAARIPDRHVAELLERALEGRGAFRRFKDTLLEFPELRQAWFAFHDARIRRQAIQWLADRGLITPETADAAAQQHPDPDLGEPPIDLDALAREVSADLRDLYGDRLARVVLFGSSARRDASDESDLDLLVVLHELSSPWDELRRMDDVLWRHTERSGVTVSALPVSASEFDDPSAPVVIRAKAEGIPVG